jgi:cold shock CspA family protein
MQGFCLFYLPEKGYGYIRPDGAAVDDPDIYTHHSNIPARKHGRKYLIKLERVAFDLGERNGKPQAINVRPLIPEQTGGSGNAQ